jgi:hypothetical protein
MSRCVGKILLVVGKDNPVLLACCIEDGSITCSFLEDVSDASDIVSG